MNIMIVVYTIFFAVFFLGVIADREILTNRRIAVPKRLFASRVALTLFSIDCLLIAELFNGMTPKIFTLMLIVYLGFFLAWSLYRNNVISHARLPEQPEA